MLVDPFCSRHGLDWRLDFTTSADQNPVVMRSQWPLGIETYLADSVESTKQAHADVVPPRKVVLPCQETFCQLRLMDPSRPHGYLVNYSVGKGIPAPSAVLKRERHVMPTEWNWRILSVFSATVFVLQLVCSVNSNPKHARYAAPAAVSSVYDMRRRLR